MTRWIFLLSRKVLLWVIRSDLVLLHKLTTYTGDIMSQVTMTKYQVRCHHKDMRSLSVIWDYLYLYTIYSILPLYTVIQHCIKRNYIYIFIKCSVRLEISVQIYRQIYIFFIILWKLLRINSYKNSYIKSVLWITMIVLSFAYKCILLTHFQLNHFAVIQSNPTIARFGN